LTDHRASARCPARRPPFTASGVLVRPVDRAIEAVPFVVRIRPQGFEQSVPSAGLGPPIEAIEHGLPWTEMVGKIPPRYAGTPPPEHRLDEVAIISSRTTCSSLRPQNRSDLRPLPLVELTSNHPAAPWSKSLPAWKSYLRRFRARARARLMIGHFSTRVARSRQPVSRSISFARPRPSTSQPGARLVK